MKKINSGVWTGIVVLIISMVFFFNALGYTYSSDLGPGPGFFPIWLSSILFILSICYIYVSINGNDSSEEMPNGKALKNILFILISMIVFCAVLPFAGFILSSTLFLFALLYGAYKWYLNLAIAIGTSAFLFFLFNELLSVQLPINILGW